MNFFAHQWTIFATQGGIKAFSFLFNAKYKWEKLIWQIAVTAFSVLTVNDCRNTIRAYMYGPTITNMKMISKMPIRLPHLRACLIYNPFNNIQFYETTSNSIDDIFAYLDTLNDSSTYVATTRNRSLNSNDLQQLKMVSWLISLATLNEFHDFKDEISPFDAYDTDTIINASWKSYGYLSKLVPQLMTPDSNVLQTISMLMWKAMSLSVSYSHGQWLNLKPIDIINEKYMTWLGTGVGFPLTQLCFKIDPKIVQFYNFYSSIRINFRHQPLFKGEGVNFAVYFGPNPSLGPDVENSVILSVIDSQLIQFKLLGHYNSMPTWDDMCNDNSSYSVMDCALKCKAAQIERFCNCSPLFSSFISTKGKLATCSQMPDVTHSNCSPEIYLKTAEICITTCYPQCERYILISERFDAPTGGNATDVRINFGSFIYPQFQETVGMDFTCLMSRLGGNLSLWIGSSFLVLLHFGLFLLQLPFEYFKSKKRSVVLTTGNGIHNSLVLVKI